MNTWYPQGTCYHLHHGVLSDLLFSLDQTTRIHGCSRGVWYEIARPQVHGYDLVGVAFLNTLRFVSVADEKVARVFDASGGFVKTVKALGVADLSVDEVRSPRFRSTPCSLLTSCRATCRSVLAYHLSGYQIRQTVTVCDIFLS